MELFAWHNVIEAPPSSARCYFLLTVMLVVCLQHKYGTSMFVFVFTTGVWCLNVCVCVYNRSMVPQCLCLCLQQMSMVPQCLCLQQMSINVAFTTMFVLVTAEGFCSCTNLSLVEL